MLDAIYKLPHYNSLKLNDKYSTSFKNFAGLILHTTNQILDCVTTLYQKQNTQANVFSSVCIVSSADADKNIIIKLRTDFFFPSLSDCRLGTKPIASSALYLYFHTK